MTRLKLSRLWRRKPLLLRREHDCISVRAAVWGRTRRRSSWNGWSCADPPAESGARIVRFASASI